MRRNCSCSLFVAAHGSSTFLETHAIDWSHRLTPDKGNNPKNKAGGLHGEAKSIAVTTGTIGLAALSSSVIAGGFALYEQSVKGLGNAFAGSAAVAEDAATLFFNPAGMTRLHGSELDAAGNLIIPSLSFQDRGSHLNRAVGGAPILFTDDGDGADLALIPNLYYVHSYDDRLKFGAGLNAPFAFLTDYEPGWQGRYHALRSEGFVINLNTSVAYRVNELLSMGVGLNAQYIDATFSNALDFSTLCLGNPASAPACRAFGLTTPGPAGHGCHVEFAGNDWSYGYNVGLLLEPANTTRIGVHYRSHIEHEVSGEADFTVPAPAFAAATGAFQDTGASATLDLPDSLTLSAYHQLDDRWAVLGDINWTHWRRFDQVVLRFDNPRQPPVVTPQDWEDTFRYALETYHPERRLILRSGLAYDETPIPNARLRSPRIPDQNRVWLTFGASYRHSEAISIDVGYAHLFIGNAAVDNTEVITGHVLSGRRHPTPFSDIGCSRVWTRLKSGQSYGFMARRVRARPRCSRAISAPRSSPVFGIRSMATTVIRRASSITSGLRQRPKHHASANRCRY